jgi:F-box and leucine-rich repeat protein 2/20
MTGIKVGSHKVPDTLARKLLFRKRRDDSRADDGTAADLQGIHAELYDFGQGNCLLPWRGDLKSRRAGASVAIPFSTLRLDHVEQPLLRCDHGGPKIKGRSYSSPLPFSCINVVTPVCADIFVPIPFIPRSYFNDIPREIRVEIVSSLLTLHQDEYERYKIEGKWTALKASSSKGKWVGRDRGVRELVKLSRVNIIPTNLFLSH